MAIYAALLFGLLIAQAPDPFTDPAVAEQLYRKAVAADDSDFGAHFNLALALSMQQKDEPAIAELRRTLELKPGLYEAEVNLGVLLLRNKKPLEALPVLKSAFGARPKDARASQLYGQALLDSGDALQAEQMFSAAIAIDAKSADAHLGLAHAFLAQSKLTEAAEHFRVSSHPAGLLDVANALEKSGKISEAIAIYKEFPDDPNVRAHIGRLTQNNHLALADSYRHTKQPDKALEEMKLALQMTPNDFELRMNYGKLLRDQRQLLPAAEQFFAATKLQPDSAPAWNELASALIIGEKYAEGLAALDRVRSLGKEIPGNMYLRAITLDKLKLKPQAIASYKQFLDAARGAHPDQEFLARQRIRIIEIELSKK